MDDYFRFTCPTCGKRLKATPEQAGRRARCSCGQGVVVPEPEAPPRAKKRAPPGRVEPERATPTKGVWIWLVAGAAGMVLIAGLGGWLLARALWPTGGGPQRPSEQVVALAPAPAPTPAPPPTATDNGKEAPAPVSEPGPKEKVAKAVTAPAVDPPMKDGAVAPRVDEKSDTIWKAEPAGDGRTTLTDGRFAVTFPAGAKVEAKGAYASVSIKQAAGARLQGHLSVERKDAPADARQAADPRSWLATFVRDQVEKDRQSVFDGKKDYNDVKLVKTSDITLGAIRGLKSITDHERALSGIRIEGGLHSVEETDHYLVGDHHYLVRAGGSGAPRAPQLFGDHTSFHRSELAQRFFQSARLRK
jgi:hypothetical protein